ncbi:F0F1 ATP synthase subunit A [Mycoplasma iguanae]|uniref:F0F1 ATP synthase subunit A n=1 Tax=Mycoplasma iguanae TaxID=292461 RepID=A0ABY5R8L9_9MOLU|nr:F0F1 ATP synthase subunit A [Mycoplasma iguanae]UVD81848.1 F0F1 ATP synthase subunit A [Mycoplasma iguanae]
MNILTESSTPNIEMPKTMAIDFAKNFLDAQSFWMQPQLFSMIIATILIIIIAVVVYFKVKKVKPNQAPNTTAYIAEQYVSLVDNMVETSGEGKMNKTAPYFFTLLTFLIFGNLLSLIGLESISTSYSVPLTLGIITWLGIYVSGIVHAKLRWFLKFAKNPLDLIGVQSSLISLTFRMFGNLIGGVVLLILIQVFTAWIWEMIPVPGIWRVNFLNSIVAVPFKFYFDIFGTLIQAFIFVLLSTIFWGTELTQDLPQKKAKKIKKSIFLHKKQTTLN